MSPDTCSALNGVIAPGARVTPDATVTLPTVPEPPRVVPESSVSGELAIEPSTIRVPAATVVFPA